MTGLVLADTPSRKGRIAAKSAVAGGIGPRELPARLAGTTAALVTAAVEKNKPQQSTMNYEKIH
jgi:hypothetical protein